MTREPRIPATIVAFDGLVAHTAAARALAVADAISAECRACTSAQVEPHLAGHSLEEAVEAMLRGFSDAAVPEVDATMRDLAVLRARRSYSAMVSQGLPLCDGILPWAHAYAAQHGRLIFRADSARRDVERLLALSGLDDVVSFVRCADDQPRPLAMRSLAASWQAIGVRLGAQGVALSACTAIECDTGCASFARPLVAQVRLSNLLS